MPEMDGREATREVRRAQNGRRRIPIVALTASAMAGDRETCYEAGMDFFLSKPVDSRKLFDTLALLAERITPEPPAVASQINTPLH